jgi:hypothetical protein
MHKHCLLHVLHLPLRKARRHWFVLRAQWLVHVPVRFLLEGRDVRNGYGVEDGGERVLHVVITKLM